MNGGAPERFRRLLEGDEVVVMPGVYDCISALLVQKAGFPTAVISSFGVAASMGMTDLGLITLTELAETAAVIARSVEIPLICDIETGFGNYLNVMRAVRAMEAAGVAGVTIEDAVVPHNRTGRPIVPLEEMVGKIQAAAEARRDARFFIAARTDATRTLGLAEAIRRGQAFAKAGADAFLALDVVVDEMRTINDAVPIPSIAIMAPHHPPMLTVEQLRGHGYKIVIPSAPPLFAAVKAMSEILSVVKSTGSLEGVTDQMAPTKVVTDLLGLPAMRELERKYLGIKEGFTPW